MINEEANFVSLTGLVEQDPESMWSPANLQHLGLDPAKREQINPFTLAADDPGIYLRATSKAIAKYVVMDCRDNP